MQVSLFSIKSVMRGTTAERKHCFGGGGLKNPHQEISSMRAGTFSVPHNGFPSPQNSVWHLVDSQY